MEHSKKQIQKKAKVITIGLIASIIIFLLVVFLFWRITEEIVLENESSFDFTVFKFLSQYTTPAITKIMLLFTFFGSTKFLLPAYILLSGYFLFFKRDGFDSASVAAIGLSSIGLLFVLKDIFHRHRPLEPLTHNVIGYSYPSGHSFSSFTFFGLLTYIIWKTNLPEFWKWILSVLFISMAVCIALSRVYLHVHFASDVLAGLCLSVIWLCISFWILNAIRTKMNVK